jgi:hypothetical protein
MLIAELTADAFLANDPVAVNLMLHGLHEAIVMMAMHRSGLRRRADGNERCQGNGGSENQVFHVEPLKHWGIMLRDCARL